MLQMKLYVNIDLLSFIIRRCNQIETQRFFMYGASLQAHRDRGFDFDGEEEFGGWKESRS